ncbi:hypothetical protein M569_03199, partial [Genlisea aurea]
MAFSVVRKDGKELRVYENVDELSSSLAEYISELSDFYIKERGAFAIALSGGSLVSLMGKLCEAPYNKTVDWPQWHIFWADERVVSKSHSDSNYKLAKDHFLSKVPIIHSHVHSINDSVTAEQAAEEYGFAIRQLVKTRVISVSESNDCPKFDLVLLGMGSDGHVASLFPNHRVLNEKGQWVTFMTDSPEPPPERITFTLPVLNSAANVAVVVSGGGKAAAMKEVVDGSDPDRSELPAKMIRPIGGESVVWFLDSAAAS